MTTLREAALKALEALEYYAEATDEPTTASGAAHILRAALADHNEEVLEMVEPVAWMYFDSDGDAIFGHPNGYRPDDAVPVYTTPQPRREPLTDEQIKKLRHNIDWTSSWSYINFARAIEAAHCITGETK